MTKRLCTTLRKKNGRSENDFPPQCCTSFVRWHYGGKMVKKLCPLHGPNLSTLLPPFSHRFSGVSCQPASSTCFCRCVRYIVVKLYCHCCVSTVQHFSSEGTVCLSSKIFACHPHVPLYVYHFILPLPLAALLWLCMLVTHWSAVLVGAWLLIFHYAHMCLMQASPCIFCSKRQNRTRKHDA